MTGGMNHEKFFYLLNALDTTFTTSQAVAVGARMGISEPIVKRYLRVEPNDPFLKRLRQGQYQKVL